MTGEAALRIPAERVRAQIEAVLAAWGMGEPARRITAEVMVETDLMGIDSHGISMLLLYDQMHRAGQLRLDAEPKIVRESKTTALLDGGAGLGHPVSVRAMELAIEKALEHDVGIVSVRNSHHHGACGYYANMAAKRGLLAMVASSSRIINVVPTFGAERVLGTNPLAFATPAGRHAPVILDMATSVVAANKVKVYALNGKPLPPGWVVDGEGRPVVDAEAAYKLLFEGGLGGLTPIGGSGKELGGHKGYGLSIFAQIFGSTLAGGSFSPVRNRTQRPGDPDNIGHFFMALNPAAFRPAAEFEEDVATIVDTLRTTARADGAQPVLLPGDPEREARAERLVSGIPMPATLLEKLREIAQAAGAAWHLEN